MRQKFSVAILGSTFMGHLFIFSDILVEYYLKVLPVIVFDSEMRSVVSFNSSQISLIITHLIDVINLICCINNFRSSEILFIIRLLQHLCIQNNSDPQNSSKNEQNKNAIRTVFIMLIKTAYLKKKNLANPCHNFVCISTNNYQKLLCAQFVCIEKLKWSERTWSRHCQGEGSIMATNRTSFRRM